MIEVYMTLEELKESVCPVFIVAVDHSNGLNVSDSGFVYDNGDTIFRIPMATKSVQDYKNSGLLDKHMVRNNFGAYVSKKALEIDPELINDTKSIYVSIDYIGDLESLKREYIARLDEILN
jgi:hypothetical protein